MPDVKVELSSLKQFATHFNSKLQLRPIRANVHPKITKKCAKTGKNEQTWHKNRHFVVPQMVKIIPGIQTANTLIKNGQKWLFLENEMIKMLCKNIQVSDNS